MQIINHRPHRGIHSRGSFRFAGFCALFALFASFFLLPAPALAQSRDARSGFIAADGPTFSVNAGFNTRYRSGNWIPVQISLSNNGADFTGSISITSPDAQNYYGNTGSQSSYQVPITLPNGSQKQITLYIPIYSSAPGITVRLLDGNGNTVRSQSSVLQPLNQGDVFAGILSDTNTGFGPLNAYTPFNNSTLLITDFLNASTFPDKATVLKNFDLIILDNFTTSTLSAKQLAALEAWVNGGGALIVAGGPEWQRTLAGLPSSLLPVSVSGTTTLRPGTRLLPVGSPSEQEPGGTVKQPVTVSTGQVTPTGETILAQGNTPLIAQGNYGEGTVCYVAFDPTLQPVVGWAGASDLWKGLLLRTLGDSLLANASAGGFSFQGQTSPFTNLLQSLVPNSLPSPWILAILLLGYIFILGPVRMIIVRWRKKRDWSWRIVLSSVVVFSVLTYGLALQQKGTSIVSNRITIVQLSQGGSISHVTTYLGIFVPNQGDYHVHFTGDGLVQPSADQYYQSGNPNSGQNTIIAPSQEGTDVNLQGVDIWTLRSLVSEQDSQVTGGIISHLTLKNGTLTGTVTNTLPAALSDVYVLMPNSYVNIGNLAAGATKSINLPLNTTTNSGTLLAAQIAAANGMPYGYVGNSQLQTEKQRHIAIMSALDGIYTSYYCGAGNPCPVAIYKRGLVIGPGGGTFIFSGGPISSAPTNDPLLIAGAPATLIGWTNAQQPGLNINTGVTVNGSSTSGVDETMIQAPLDVQYSGTLNLPSSLLNAQIINVEGSNVQSPVPGFYTLTQGSVTFEFVLPDAAHLQSEDLILSEPNNVTQIGNTGGSGPLTDGSQQALLYNWDTHSWDPITFTAQTFSPVDTAAYIGPGGRVLVQFGNQNASSNTIVFDKPALNLQGVAGQ